MHYSSSIRVKHSSDSTIVCCVLVSILCEENCQLIFVRHKQTIFIKWQSTLSFLLPLEGWEISTLYNERIYTVETVEQSVEPTCFTHPHVCTRVHLRMLRYNKRAASAVDASTGQ